MSEKDPSRRTHQRVWRDSFVLGGDYEAEVFRPYDRDEMAVCLEAAERFDRRNKRKGDRNGPIGHVGLEVYRALWRRANFRSGRCDPSIERIMQDTGRSRRAVVWALKRLWNVGLVRWLRRFVYTGERGIRGPQVQQATNAYELRMLSEPFLSLLSPGKRARYRPKARPWTAPQPAPRKRGKQSPMLRIGAAWGRMGEAIREQLGAIALVRLQAAARALEALDQRESTKAVQTLPDGYISSS